MKFSKVDHSREINGLTARLSQVDEEDENLFEVLYQLASDCLDLATTMNVDHRIFESKLHKVQRGDTDLDLRVSRRTAHYEVYYKSKPILWDKQVEGLIPRMDELSLDLAVRAESIRRSQWSEPNFNSFHELSPITYEDLYSHNQSFGKIIRGRW